MYDADGGTFGELRYVVGKALARRHCSLCDITHGRLRVRADWKDVAARLEVPITLLHRNELGEEERRAADGRLPSVLARRGQRLDLLLGPDELLACDGDPAEFERRVRAAAVPDDPSGHR